MDKKYYIVQTKEELELLYNHIKDSDTIAVDTETSGLNPRRDKVVGWSVSGEEGIGFYLPTLVWNFDKDILELQHIDGQDTETLSRRLLAMLKGKKLVFHNASFDVQFIKNFYGVDLTEDIWVDTGLLVHTVYEEGAPMTYGSPFALKSIAKWKQDELGLDVEKAANEEQVLLKESILKNGGKITKAEFEIYKADLELLGEYAAADTDLTLRICNLFLNTLRDEGLEDFFFKEEVMPIYREVTLPMEQYGVDLDVELLEKTNEEIVKDQEEHKTIFKENLMKLSEAQSWIVSQGLKKFPPKHNGSWAQKLIMMKSLPLPRSPKTGKYSTTAKNLEALEDSVYKDFLQNGKAYCEKFQMTHDFADLKLPEKEILKISIELWKEHNDGEYINIQSTKHVGEIVFDFMGIKPLSTTPKGDPQFDMPMILKMRDMGYEWFESLYLYNKLLKIKSTYIDRFLERGENGRYYFYFKQNGTVSGRYGSDAQQLPKPKEEDEAHPLIVKYNNVVRAFLIAGKGRKVIDADYESLEPHCFASVTGDKGLQDVFNNGWDFYSTVAIKTEKLDNPSARIRTMKEGKLTEGTVGEFYPKGVSADKKADNFLKKVDPFKRNTAKGYALGIAYGMEAFALSKGLNCDQKTAQELLDGYLNGFPQLKEWRVRSRNQAKTEGLVRNFVGRIRHLPKVKRTFEKFGDRMMDWRFRKELEKEFGKDQVLKAYRDYRNGLNNCLNFQLQSLAAAVVNRAAVQINRKAKELGVDAIVQAQVHDQLIINVAEEQAEMFAPYVQEIMETTTQLPGVTLKAPPEIADNWKEGH